MTNDVLKPCPFCGGDAEIERMGTSRVSMIISCGMCGASVETGETWIDENSCWNTRAALTPVDGNTSDGYHTFNELYEHRHSLFLTICKIYKDRAWKSKFHSDDTMFDGWFIAGITTTDGQATYHLPLRLWDDFTVSELPMSPPWDGHTPNDVINRIKRLAARGFGVPEGYALVPLEPTDKILNAMAEQCDGYNENYYFDIYKAMIKAAPKKED